MSPLPPSEGRHSPVGGWHGSAGWGDAAVIVPWELYRAYGDAADPRRAVGVDDRLARLRGTGGRRRAAPVRAARSAAPAAHERYLWDTGFHFGEWKVPGEEITDMAA